MQEFFLKLAGIFFAIFLMHECFLSLSRSIFWGFLPNTHPPPLHLLVVCFVKGGEGGYFREQSFVTGGWPVNLGGLQSLGLFLGRAKIIGLILAVLNHTDLHNCLVSM